MDKVLLINRFANDEILLLIEINFRWTDGFKKIISLMKLIIEIELFFGETVIHNDPIRMEQILMLLCDLQFANKKKFIHLLYLMSSFLNRLNGIKKRE